MSGSHNAVRGAVRSQCLHVDFMLYCTVLYWRHSPSTAAVHHAPMSLCTATGLCTTGGRFLLSQGAPPEDSRYYLHAQDTLVVPCARDEGGSAVAIGREGYLRSSP